MLTPQEEKCEMTTKEKADALELLAHFPFDPDTPEIGYVVVDSPHRGNKPSSRMAKMLSEYPGQLFASMKSALPAQDL